MFSRFASQLYVASIDPHDTATSKRRSDRLAFQASFDPSPASRMLGRFGKNGPKAVIVSPCR